MLLFALIILSWVLWTILMRATVDCKGRLSLPPSPCGRLPLLGHLWRLDATKPFESLHAFSLALGDVCCVYFGGTPVVVLSRGRILREAFQQDGWNFSARPQLWVHEHCWGKGTVLHDSQQNVVLRKMIQRFFRDRSHGPDSIQEIVTREIAKMFVHIEKQMNCEGFADVCLENVVFYVVGNVLTQLVFGTQHEHGSQDFMDAAWWLPETTRLMEKCAPLTFLPWLRHLPPLNGALRKMKVMAASVHAHHRQLIDQRRRSGEYKDPARNDLISSFMRAIDEEAKADDANELVCTDVLVRLVTEMFFAGIQTECNTFGWAFLFFLENPRAMAECRSQLRDTVDAEDDIRWADKAKTPLLEATIAEVQRLANITPFSMPHATRKDTILDGFFIPANSFVFMNLYSTLIDEDAFENPRSFEPSRFLTPSGRLEHSKMAASMPYGLGPRMCLGETIARLELFCVIGSLLRRYSFEKIPGENYSLEQKMQLTIQPPKYKIRVRLL